MPTTKKKSKTPVGQFVEHATCAACGLTRHDAPVDTRWLSGMAVVLCHECWRSPTDAVREPNEVDQVPAFRLAQGVTVKGHGDTTAGNGKKQLTIGLVLGVGLVQIHR